MVFTVVGIETLKFYGTAPCIYLIVIFIIIIQRQWVSIGTSILKIYQIFIRLNRRWRVVGLNQRISEAFNLRNYLRLDEIEVDRKYFLFNADAFVRWKMNFISKSYIYVSKEYMYIINGCFLADTVLIICQFV